MSVQGAMYLTEISVCCNRGHNFAISYQKKLTYLSCLDCQRVEKMEQRQREIELENARKEECRKMQEALFNQAKINMERNNPLPGNPNYGFGQGDSFWRYDACHFAQIEQSVN
jgi:hypothetical protein